MYGNIGKGDKMKVICPNCKEEREVVRLRRDQTGRCPACAQIKTKVKPRYFRICPDCGDSKEVLRVGLSGIRRCAPCAHKHKWANYTPKYKPMKHRKQTCALPPKPPKPSKTPTGKYRATSPEAIARQRQINKEHRDSLNKEKTKIALTTTIPEQKLSDEDMIAAFYAKKEQT